MEKYIAVSIQAARMRLSRQLLKRGQKLLINRVDTPSQLEFGRYMIVTTEDESLIAYSNVITPWLKEMGIIKIREYVEGEQDNEN